MQRLRCLVCKEFLELRQNPRLFGLVIVAPIIQLTMLGYAATTDVKDVPVVVADGDRSPASRNLIARFEASPNFTVIDTVTTVRDVDPYLQRGQAWIALAIPQGYGRALARAANRSRSRSWPTAPTRTRRPSRSATRPRLIGEYAPELARARRLGVGGKRRCGRDRRSASASGSTRSSRAASS